MKLSRNIRIPLGKRTLYTYRAQCTHCLVDILQQHSFAMAFFFRCCWWFCFFICCRRPLLYSYRYPGHSDAVDFGNIFACINCIFIRIFYVPFQKKRLHLVRLVSLLNISIDSLLISYSIHNFLFASIYAG